MVSIRIIATILLAAISLAAPAGQAPGDAPDVQAIVRRSVEQDWANLSKARDYTFVRREETHRLDRAGGVKQSESKTFDVVIIGERPYEKLIEEDDRPLEGRKARKAQEEFDKAVRKSQDLSESERHKQAEERRKEEEEARRFVREIPEAFTFEFVRNDQIDALPVWVIRATPRAGFKPKEKRAAILSKFQGVLWIDQKDYQWVRIEAEVIDTVSFGWVLARLGKGTTLTFQQTRVNDELWLPSKATTRINAKLALLKSIRAEVNVQWREYRKFRTESRIVPPESQAQGTPR